MNQVFKNVLELERHLQASLFNFFNKSIGPPEKQAPDTTTAQTSPGAPPVVYSLLHQMSLSPINVSGFYKVTGPTEATFYATTDKPITPIGPGWYSDGITSIQGKIRVKSVSLDKGPGYVWSFVFQIYKSQNIQGTQQVVSATLFPPARQTQGTKFPMYGYYTITAGVLTFFFTTPPPNGSLTGWIATGLPRVPGILKVTNYGLNYATLVSDDGGELQSTNTTVKVNGFPASLQESELSSFIPGKFTDYISPGDALPNVKVAINPNIKVGYYTIQRDLNTDTSWSDIPPDGRIFPQGLFIEPGTGIKGWKP